MTMQVNNAKETGELQHQVTDARQGTETQQGTHRYGRRWGGEHTRNSTPGSHRYLTQGTAIQKPMGSYPNRSQGNRKMDRQRAPGAGRWRVQQSSPRSPAAGKWRVMVGVG